MCPLPDIPVLGSKDHHLAGLEQQDAGLIFFHLMAGGISCAFIDGFVVKQVCYIPIAFLSDH